MQRILQIGLTGGIGAGKSTIAEIFNTMGIPVYSADFHARELMEKDETLIDSIRQLLGPEAYIKGRLNRKWIAAKVFNDHNLLTRLNYLVHPVVHRHAQIWHLGQRNVPFTLKEAALTYESGQYLSLDAVICVEASEETRVARVMNRDKVTESAVLARMKNQWPSYRRRQLADFIIENDRKQSIVKQAVAIHRQLCL